MTTRRAVSPLRQALPWALPGLTALAVGLAVWTPLPPGLWHDDGVYVLLGRALAEGEGLRYVGVPGAPPAAKFPPGYPLVTAAAWLVAGDPVGTAVVASLANVVFLAAAAALLGAFAARGLGLPLPLAAAAGVLPALSVDLWRPALVALSEPLYLALVPLALWAALRVERHGGWPALAGLVAALAALVYVRTAGAAVAAAVVLGLGVRRRWGEAVIVAAALGAALAPWAVFSSVAAGSLPPPLRDVLGPYGSWLAGQVAERPGAYLGGLPGGGAAVAGRWAALLLPGLPPGGLWVAGPALGAGAAAGAVALFRRSPSAALALLLLLVQAWLWPFRDRRLVLPLIPLSVLALACLAGGLLEGGSSGRAPPPDGPEPPPGGARREAGSPARRGRRLRGVALGAMSVWAVAFAAVSAVRLARDWVPAGYRIREATLSRALEMVERGVPPGGVVGAPELWPAFPLLADRRAAPSARFLPLPPPGEPSWGSPRDQMRLWEAAGIDHVLLEQGGAIHGGTLDRLEAECPGAVGIVATTPGLILVRLGWDDACRLRVTGG